jgi:hypothetical protein
MYKQSQKHADDVLNTDTATGFYIKLGRRDKIKWTLTLTLTLTLTNLVAATLFKRSFLIGVLIQFNTDIQQRTQYPFVDPVRSVGV